MVLLVLQNGPVAKLWPRKRDEKAVVGTDAATYLLHLGGSLVCSGGKEVFSTEIPQVVCQQLPNRGADNTGFAEYFWFLAASTTWTQQLK